MNRFKLRVLLLILVTFFYSCSSDDDASSSGSFMRATIDGESWESTEIEFSTLTQSESQNAQRYDLTAFSESFKVTISIFDTTGVNPCMPLREYNRAEDEALVSFFYGLGNDIFVSEHSSTVISDDSIISDVTVNITSCEGAMISGTFSGTFYKNGNLSGLNTPEIVEITDGVFQNIPYTIFSL
ncbi:MAG: hypothetical protein ACI9Y7_001597 [Dokdonia sp.]|jgi:hypothetical protein